MEWDFIWKAVLIIFAGTLLLRIAGRKTISQMTLAETVIMIAIGSLLIQPVAGENIWVTLLVGATLIATLILMEYVQIKFDFFEGFITGKSKVVVNNGIINEKNLKKLRLTVDQLEMKLRQKGVTNISDVQWATLEPNGQLGLDLKQDAKPVTKKEFQQFQQTLQPLLSEQSQLFQLNQQLTELNHKLSEQNIFTEVEKERT